MRKHELRGAGTVFRYTVQQHYKTVSIVVFLAVLFLLALAAFPIAALMSGGETEIEETVITTLYLRNETGFALEHPDILSDARYAGLDIRETDADDAALAETLAKESKSVASAVAADESGMMFSIKTYYGENSIITSADAATLNTILENALHEAILRSLSVTDEQAAEVGSRVVSQVAKAADYGSGSEEVNTDTHVFASMFYSYAVMILGALAMSYIFQLCMEEKVSKLVESLLVSVPPTALLIGKLLAVTLFLFVGIGLVAAGLLISFQLAKAVGDVSFIRDALVNSIGFDPASLHISAGTLILLVPCVLLAYAISACFSGIVGSCCSKTEDTQQASLAVVLFMMIGYLTGAFAPMFESDAANYFFSLFPLTSMYVAFPNYVCGKIGLGIFLIGLILQAVTAFLLARAAGVVYKIMLLYRGSVPKPAQLINMLKENRAAAKTAAGKEDAHGK